MRVIGLDLSLRATGLAVIDTDTGAITVSVVKTRAARVGTSEHARIAWVVDRLDMLGHAIAEHAMPHRPPWVNLACIEGPSFGSQGGQAHERAGLWWSTVGDIHRYGTAFAVIPPTTLKAYATGKGNADKILMMQAAMKRLGDRCPDLPDDNACDALWLALAAAHRVGAPQVALPAAQVARLDAVSWPELLSDDLDVTA